MIDLRLDEPDRHGRRLTAAVWGLTDAVDALTARLASVERGENWIAGPARGWEAFLRREAVRDRVLRRLAAAVAGVGRPSAAGSSRGALRFAGGGDVRGAGGPRDDRIPALLSNGEFVVNAGAAARHRALLRAINGEGGRGPSRGIAGAVRFAGGGEAGGDPYESRPLTIHRLDWKPPEGPPSEGSKPAQEPGSAEPAGAKRRAGHRHRAARPGSAKNRAIVENNKAAMADALSKAGLSEEEQTQIFGQIEAESGFITKREGVKYSPERFLFAFPKHVRDVEDARELIAQGPQAMFARVYGGRNGNDKFGDGLRYRGRGFVQLSNRSGYADMDRALGLNGALVENPDLALRPDIAVRIVAEYYRSRSERINGTGQGRFDLTTPEGATLATGPSTPDAVKIRRRYAERYRGRMSGYAERGAALESQGAPPPPADGDGAAPRRYAAGGEVRGPGGPRSDAIPARLSPGEFVVNADAAARHRAVLEAINRGDLRAPGYAAGGSVAAADGAPSFRFSPAFFSRLEDRLGLRPPTPLGYTTKGFDGKAPAIMRGLMDRYDLTEEQAAGVVGNLGHETTGFKSYHEERKARRKGGVGWAQWTNTGPGSGMRRKAFEDWAQAYGLDPTSDEASWRYLTEVDPEMPGAIEAVKRTSSRHDAVRAFHDHFERSADIKNGRIVVPTNWNDRLRYSDRAVELGPDPPRRSFQGDPTDPYSGRDAVPWRREAERAVLPGRPPAAAPAGEPARHAGVDVKVSGLDDLREAHGHIDAIHRKVAGLGGVNLRVRHEGFGDRGERAPVSMRTSLNGAFSSDGRAIG